MFQYIIKISKLNIETEIKRALLNLTEDYFVEMRKYVNVLQKLY